MKMNRGKIFSIGKGRANSGKTAYQRWMADKNASRCPKPKTIGKAR